jgi:hypothetical protein
MIKVIMCRLMAAGSSRLKTLIFGMVRSGGKALIRDSGM